LFFIDPTSVSISVSRGVVRLAGEMETRSLAELVVKHVAQVEGTVAVDSKLTFRLDDSALRVGPPPGSLHLSASERRRI
jgi:osmotically-inducible protein OsmY